eukprot:TRINITY_DN33397_c0_g1_i1.p1 TRINITY_DN33397_c0_g1~~TRINITY_DN33397_c0_g1_i1.p1  ORF type:complete len:190 (-),score=26.66 TRINITY_DN33397_c0_g1_i1:63-632(-)
MARTEERESRSRSPAKCSRDVPLQVPSEKPTVTFSFDVSQHLRRRRSARPLVGLPMGTLPSNPQQNAQLGAPFAYSHDQAQLDGIVRELPGKMSPHAAVHADLTDRGYFVVSALRHGFDFVVYEGDPVRHHGSHFVVVADPHQPINPRQLVLWHRLAAAAHKTVLLASVRTDAGAAGTPSYVTICGEER